jgi:tetratricopeptide (TPR) repeat protein
MPDPDRRRPDPSANLKHHAFWEAAGALPEGSVAFNALTAALLVLRLLDRWSSRDKGREVKFQELAAVQRRVDALPDGPMRRVLQDLLKSVGGRGAARPAKVIVLGQLLEAEGYWAPAADAYASSIELIASRPVDRDLLPFVLDRQAYCLRESGQLDKAAEMYNEGIAVARELQDIRWALKLRVHNAILEGMHRGDLPEADYQLEVIVDDARNADLPALVAYATHERGQVAFARSQYLNAAQLFYIAATTHLETSLIERAELDLAVALAELGHIDYARTVCEFVRNAPARLGSDQRTLAGINLMRLAPLRDDRDMFDKLRLELAVEPMKGRLLAHYHLILAQGLLRFGESDAGRLELQRTIEVAEAYKINQLVIRADELLKAKDERHQTTPQVPLKDRSLDPILRAIDERQGPFAEAVQ